MLLDATFLPSKSYTSILTILLDELIFKISLAGFGYNEIVLLVFPKSAVLKVLSKTIESIYTEFVEGLISNAAPTTAPVAGTTAPVESHIPQFVVSNFRAAASTAVLTPVKLL